MFTELNSDVESCESVLACKILSCVMLNYIEHNVYVSSQCLIQHFFSAPLHFDIILKGIDLHYFIVL